MVKNPVNIRLPGAFSFARVTVKKSTSTLAIASTLAARLDVLARLEVGFLTVTLASVCHLKVTALISHLYI